MIVARWHSATTSEIMRDRASAGSPITPSLRLRLDLNYAHLDPPVTLPLPPNLVFDRPSITTVESLFDLVAGRAARLLGGVDVATLSELLNRRERELCTATPEGIAFPHAVDDRLGATLVGAVRLATPLQFGTVHPPCRYAFVLFGSGEEPWRHVRLLARIARIVSDPRIRTALDAAADRRELRRCLLEADARLG